MKMARNAAIKPVRGTAAWVVAVSLLCGAAWTAAQAPNLPATRNGTATYSLKFQDAPLDMVLNSYAEITGKTMIKAPGLNATISLRSQTPLTREEYMQAVESALALHGITFVPMGEKFLRVVQSTAARQEGMRVTRVSPDDPFPETDALASQIFQLQHISIPEAQPILQSVLHAYGKIQPMEQVNALMVTDTSANLLRVSEILDFIDRPIALRVETRIYELRYAEAERVAGRLAELISEQQPERPPAPRRPAAPDAPATPPGVIRARQASREPQAAQTDVEMAERGLIRGTVKIVPDDRTNILIVISEPSNFVFFDRVISVLDRPVEPEVVVRVFALQYANAEEIAALLNEFIGSAREGAPVRGAAEAAESEDARSRLLREYAVRRAAERREVAPDEARALLGDLSQDTRILSDKRTNSLLVRGRRSDVAALVDIIDQLDVMLAQVLIEAVIIEVGLSDSLSYGLNWLQRSMTVYQEEQAGGAGVTVREPVFAFAGGQKLGDSVDFQDAGTLTGDAGRAMSLTSGGLSYYMTFYDLNLDAVINMAAGSSDANILSTPVILTTDNTEARIIVGEQRPVVTASSTTAAGEQRSVYEYKNIGINLTVTPRINPNRMVNMQIEQSVDNVGDFEIIDGNRVPIITKREFSAEIAVSNRSTIVLGGLVSSDVRKSRAKVPLLGDIPLLGMLFRSDTRSTAKRELLVLLTPYVLISPDEVTEETSRLHGAVEGGEEWRQGWSSSHLAIPPDEGRQVRWPLRRTEKEEREEGVEAIVLPRPSDEERDEDLYEPVRVR